MEIRIEHLCKAYDRQPLFRDFSATVQNGEHIVITGVSGIGKSTLLRLLLNLEAPDSGQILFNGQNLHSKPLQAGVLFQEDRLFPDLTAEANISAVLPTVSPTQIRSALLELLPSKSLSKPVSLYSGGMRRRVALIRACLSPSSLVLLDEPFAGLDDETAEKAADFIKTRCEGRTLIITTHSNAHLQTLRQITLSE